MQYKRIPVNNFIGYEIDTDGNVWSYKHNSPKKLKYSKRGGRNQDYYAVTLYRDDKPHNLSLHKLLAEHFIDNPNNCAYVCHDDGNPLNNEISNLYWGTPKQNQHDRFKHGTDMLGSKNGKAKLNEAKVRVIKSILKYNWFNLTQSDIAKVFSVCQSNIASINSGYSWSHINV